MVDIPTHWETRTNKHPTGVFVAPPAAWPCCSSPVPPTTKKVPRPKDLAASFLVDIPMRWEPRAKQQQRVALADFSAVPWQDFEKSERGPNNSSLFQPQACGRRRCTGLIAYSASQSRPVRVLYRPPRKKSPDQRSGGIFLGRHSYALGTAG